MAVDTFADLLRVSGRSAASSKDWLGSERHRRLLDGALGSVLEVDDASVVWIPPGSASFWQFETRTINLERPVRRPGLTLSDSAEWTAISLLHETFHARFSDQLGPFPRRHGDLPQTARDTAHLIFQRLEDAHITALGLSANPDLAEPLDKFTREICRQFVMHYAKRGNANTSGPRSLQSQLLFALEMYAIRPSQPVTLNPRVQARFNSLKAKVDEARSGSSEDCDRICVPLSRAVLAMPP
jgi:hypothetical protein